MLVSSSGKEDKILNLLKNHCRTHCLGTGNEHSVNSLQLPLGDQYWESLLCNEMQNIFLFPHVQYLILFPWDASNDTMDKRSLPAKCHPWEDIKDEQTRARGGLIVQKFYTQFSAEGNVPSNDPLIFFSRLDLLLEQVWVTQLLMRYNAIQPGVRTTV